MGNFFKKTDKSILIVMVLVIVMIGVLLIDGEPEKKVKEEKFTFQDDSKDIDVASQLAKQKEETEKKLKEMQQEMQNKNKSLEDMIYGFKKSNVVKIVEEGDSKLVTLTSGEIYKVNVGIGDKVIDKQMVGTLFDINKKKLGNIVKEIKLPNGDYIFETADGKKYLMKKDGTVVPLDSYSIDENGNYVLHTADGEVLMVTPSGIKKAVQNADGSYTLVDNEPVIGVDGNKYMQEADGAYMIDKNGNKIKVGEELFTDENGNVFVKRSDGVYQLQPDGTWKKVADDIFQDENGKIYLKTKDGIFKVNKDGSLEKVGNTLTVDKDGNIIIDGKIVGKLKKKKLPIVDGNSFKSLKDLNKKIKSATMKDGVKYVQEKDGVYRIDANGNKVRVGDKLEIDANGNVLIDGKPVGKALTFEDTNNALFDEDGNLIFAQGTVFDENGKEFLNKIFEDENGNKYLKDVNGNIVKVKDAWYDKDGNLHYIDEMGKEHTLKDGKEVFVGPNGELFLNEIFEDENGKYLMTPDGKKVYVKDAWFDANGNLNYVDMDGNKHKLTQKYGTSFNENGEEFVDGIFEDENGKYLLKANGEKVYVDNAIKDANGNIVYTDKDGNKHTLKNGDTKLFKMTNDVKEAIGEDGYKYVQEADGVYRIDKYGNKVKVGDKMTIDKNGNIVIDGKILTKAKSWVLSDNGSLEVLGFGSIVTDELNNPVISFEKMLKKYLGKNIVSFNDVNGNNYYEIDNKIYKNNVYFDEGKLFYQQDLNVVNVYINKTIKRILKGVDKFDIDTIEFKTKDNLSYKIFDVKVSNEDGNNNIKRGSIIEISSNGEVKMLGEGSILLENKKIIIKTLDGKETTKDLNIIKASTGYLFDDKLIINKDNEYIKVNLVKINDIIKYNKVNTKLVKNENVYELHTINDKEVYLGDIISTTSVYVENEKNRYQIENKYVENGRIFEENKLNSLNSKSEKAYVLNNGNTVFNFDNNTVVSANLPNGNKQSKLNGNLEIKGNKLFIKPTQMTKETFGTVKTIFNLMNSSENSLFKYKDNNYSLDNNGIEDLGQGEFKIIENSVYKILDKEKRFLGDLQYNKTKYFDEIEFNVSGAFIERKDSKILPKDGQYVAFGEILILEENERAFYNENNEVMFIDKLSNVKNLGKGNLIIYNINGEDRLYFLQNGNYKNLGKVLKKDVSDNTIYRTTKGLYYILNNNVNKIEKNILYDLKMIPEVKKDKLFGIDREKKKIFLGDILNVLSGEFDKADSSLIKNLKDLGKINKIAKDDNGNDIVIDEKGNKFKPQSITTLSNGDIKIVDKNGNEIIIPKDNLTSLGKNYIVEQNILNSLVKIYKDNNGLWFGELSNNEVLKLKEVEFLANGGVKVTDFNGNIKIFTNNEILKDKENYNISNNPMDMLKEVLKDENGKWYYINSQNNKENLVKATFNYGDLSLQDSYQNTKVIKKQYILEKSQGYFVNNNPLNNIVKISNDVNGNWFGTDDLGYKVKLSKLNVNVDNSIEISLDFDTKRNVLSKDILNETTVYTIYNNPLKNLMKIVINEKNNTYEGYDINNKFVDINTFIKMSNGDIKISDKKSNILTILKQNIKENGNTILIENVLSDIISIEKNKNKVTATKSNGKTMDLSKIEIFGDDILVTDNNNKKDIVTNVNILSKKVEYSLMNKKSSPISKIYEENNRFFYFDLSNNKKDIKAITEVNGELKVVLDNDDVLTFANKEYLKISDIYKIKFNDLDKIEKIYQETNGKWYGVSFNNDKIELKSVEVLANGDYEIRDFFENVRVISYKKLIKFDNKIFYITHNELDKITSLKYDKIFNEWSNENILLKSVTKIDENNYLIVSKSEETRLVPSNELKLEKRILLLKINYLNQIKTLEKIDNVWVGKDDKGNNINVTNVLVSKNSDLVKIENNENVRFVSSLSFKQENDKITIDNNSLDRIIKIDNIKNKMWLGTTDNGEIIDISSIKFNKEVMNIIDKSGNEKIINLSEIKKDNSDFVIDNNPIDVFVKILEKDNQWFGYDEKDNEERLLSVELLKDGSLLVKNMNGVQKIISFDKIKTNSSKEINLKANDLNKIVKIIKDEDGNYYGVTADGKKIKLNLVENKNGQLKLIDDKGNETNIDEKYVVVDGENMAVGSKSSKDLKWDSINGVKKINGNYYVSDDKDNLISVKSVKEMDNGNLKITSNDNKEFEYDKRTITKNGSDYTIVKTTENKEKIKFMTDDESVSLFEEKLKKEEKAKLKKEEEIAETKLKNVNDISKIDVNRNKFDKTIKPKLLIISSKLSVEKNNTLFGSVDVNGKLVKNVDKTKETKEDEKTFMLPIGTKLDVTLKGGSMAVLGEGNDDPLLENNRAIFVVNRNVMTADGESIPLKEAVVSAKPIATNIKRMVFELDRIHFYDDETEEWYIGELTGQVLYKFDGVPGIPGVIIDKKDEYLAKATIYSALEGITDYLVATKSPISAINQLTTTSPRSSVGETMVGGMKNGLGDIRDSILKVAERQKPILIIKGSQEAEIEIYEPIVIEKQGKK